MSDEHENYIDHLRAALLDSSNRFDSAVLTLSSGLLALSLTFLRDLGPSNEPDRIGYLIGSWVSLGAAIIATVVSFLASGNCIRDRLERRETRAKRWISVTKWLNRVASLMFVVGIGLSIAFVSLNLSKGDLTMSDRDRKPRDPLTEGYVPENKPLYPGEERGYIPPEPPKEKPADSKPTEDKD